MRRFWIYFKHRTNLIPWCIDGGVTERVMDDSKVLCVSHWKDGVGGGVSEVLDIFGLRDLIDSEADPAGAPLTSWKCLGVCVPTPKATLGQ